MLATKDGKAGGPSSVRLRSLQSSMGKGYHFRLEDKWRQMSFPSLEKGTRISVDCGLV